VPFAERWIIKMKVKQCCEKMKYFVNQKCNMHDDAFCCPDIIMFYEEKFDEYGIIIHDSGKSYIKIEFCPWCGKKLPDSKRDSWFIELEKQGIMNPFEEDIPEKFNSGAWWKNKE